MGFMEEMHMHHKSLFQALDGRMITYIPQGKEARLLPALFQAFTEVAGGETVDVVMARPILSVRTGDVSGVQTGDVFFIDGQDYEAAVIQPDSEGITEIRLEKL
jgi:hypothetical protein